MLFTIVALAWVALVVMLLVNGGVTLYNIFVVVASGIIVLVPMYKKYVKKND